LGTVKRNNATENQGIAPMKNDGVTAALYAEGLDEEVDPEAPEVIERVAVITAAQEAYDRQAEARELGDSKGGSNFNGGRPPRRAPIRNRPLPSTR
jgi:hypothetical protein